MEGVEGTAGWRVGADALSAHSADSTPGIWVHPWKSSRRARGDADAVAASRTAEREWGTLVDDPDVAGSGCKSLAAFEPSGVPTWRMHELTVRVLDERDWPIYREIRLAALQESPGVFGDRYDAEAAADQTYWRSQLAAARRIVAESDGSPCGVVAVRSFDQEPGSVELFGLWVDPTARSTGVAGRLVDTAATLAAVEGATQMYYWAGTENGPAIGFATGFGFRITSHRRPATSGDDALGDTEIALALALEDDPHIVPNATVGRLRR